MSVSHLVVIEAELKQVDCALMLDREQDLLDGLGFRLSKTLLITLFLHYSTHYVAS